MRRCTACREEKSLTEFAKCARSPDGLNWRCRACIASYYVGFKERRDLGLTDPKKGRKPREVPDGHRWCSSCKQPVPRDNFTGRETNCRECRHNRHIQKRSGLTREEYERLTATQGNLCAICRKREHRYVDHCHETGRARGLLCPSCNTGLGFFYDDPEVLLRAAKYLTSIARYGE